MTTQASILAYYDYAKLSTAAYVDMSKHPYYGFFTIEDFIREAGTETETGNKKQERLPDALAKEMFRTSTTTHPVWAIPQGGYQGNTASGFAATLFQRGQEKVLAIRGTETMALDAGYSDLLKADLHEIGEYGMAISQAVCLFNLVQCLLAPARPTHGMPQAQGCPA